MNGKRFIDIMTCSLAAAVMILSYVYMEKGNVRQIILVAGGIVFLYFLLLAFADSNGAGRRKLTGRRKFGTSGGLCSLMLLNEDGEEIAEWNIAGKVSLLIGRDSYKENVDINLMNTEFAGMVDRQHAVMNYTAGRWYIEDLDSTNGIRIQKEKDGKIYEISKGQPCLVERGDILIIGLTRLAVR